MGVTVNELQRLSERAKDRHANPHGVPAVADPKLPTWTDVTPPRPPLIHPSEVPPWTAERAYSQRITALERQIIRLEVERGLWKSRAERAEAMARIDVGLMLFMMIGFVLTLVGYAATVPV
jgi:hypothetical protein